jgi:endonuclease YncB( thermonuclease family)
VVGVVVRRLPLLLVLLAAVFLGAAASDAHAARGDCVVGEPRRTCTVWTGRVISVDDGDTIDVDIFRDGTSRPRRVRVAGMQAMEQTAYSSRHRQGECHAVEATLRLEQLIRRSKWTVRLAAENPESRSRNRLLRTLAVRLRGRWRDVGSIMLREGRALWWGSPAESSPNATYGAITQGAIAAQRRLFDPDSCGVGPSPASPLKLWVNWDADGDDTANPSGEWVKIKNLDTVNPVPLAGWYLRDSALRRFTFPASAVIAPGGTVTVDVGDDTDAPGPPGTVFSWGLSNPVFENATHDEDAMGDGGYLFDPLGNIRALMIYPCGSGCTDPAQGTVALSADPAVRRESVTISNLTAGDVDLEGYVLKSPPYSYHLGPGSILPAGETMKILVSGAPEDDDRLLKHWGFARPILRNAGDLVRLSTYSDLTLACTAWGDKTC